MMAAHDAEHRGQAEPAAGRLGGEERIEDPQQGRSVHTATAIAHLEEREAHRAQVRCSDAARDVDRIAALLAAAQRDPAAAVGQRFGGIGDQVEHDLPKLGGVAQHERDRGGQLELQLGAARHGHAQELGRLVHQRGEVDVLLAQLTAAGVREHLARDLARARRCRLDRQRVPAQG
jgi:hypothetical protein